MDPLSGFEEQLLIEMLKYPGDTTSDVIRRLEASGDTVAGLIQRKEEEK